MKFPQAIFLLAALTVGGAEAAAFPLKVTLLTSVTSPANRVVDSNLDKRDGCSQIFPQPKLFRCGSQGYINDDSGILDDSFFQPAAEGCADSCLLTTSCTAFSYRFGSCQLFSGDFGSYGFSEVGSFTYWYQMDCFDC